MYVYIPLQASEIIHPGRGGVVKSGEPVIFHPRENTWHRIPTPLIDLVSSNLHTHRTHATRNCYLIMHVIIDAYIHKYNWTFYVTFHSQYFDLHESTYQEIMQPFQPVHSPQTLSSLP